MMLPLLVESTLPLLNLRTVSRYVLDKCTSTAVTCVPSDSRLLSSSVRSLHPRPTPCVMLVAGAEPKSKLMAARVLRMTTPITSPFTVYLMVHISTTSALTLNSGICAHTKLHGRAQIVGRLPILRPTCYPGRRGQFSVDMCCQLLCVCLEQRLCFRRVSYGCRLGNVCYLRE
ncbi:hypothetical protein PISMIDRAFT_433793 [Pisolithus microcarpus 441]|uniref:Unplaced genomic scaffold scaffold_387, whole genome shotgun sequence n=1 Tax=Pisolithus microcarpus 441 TaxID=765257 RepID=A0A0C9XJU7_9AGAM|nr:hypothetical protein BKA83DRAFT_433793 [Pisolithus microcarpus]KIK12555.1 hypothetical protein PISMIDRAFT_433793 [Pisolithus microcarpus 441]